LEEQDFLALPTDLAKPTPRAARQVVLAHAHKGNSK
jgi:hypothetical protein